MCVNFKENQKYEIDQHTKTKDAEMAGNLSHFIDMGGGKKMATYDLKTGLSIEKGTLDCSSVHTN